MNDIKYCYKCSICDTYYDLKKDVNKCYNSCSKDAITAKYGEPVQVEQTLDNGVVISEEEIF